MDRRAKWLLGVLGVAAGLGIYFWLAGHFEDGARLDLANGQVALDALKKKDHQMGEDFFHQGNFEMARNYFLKGAERNQPYDEDWMGSLYENGQGVGQDYAVALAWFQKAADQNDPTGEARVGYYYEYGYGVDADPGKARAWLKKAANQGNAMAAGELEKLPADGN
jgi:TPR repeat protein